MLCSICYLVSKIIDVHISICYKICFRESEIQDRVFNTSIINFLLSSFISLDDTGKSLFVVMVTKQFVVYMIYILYAKNQGFFTKKLLKILAVVKGLFLILSCSLLKSVWSIFANLFLNTRKERNNCFAFLLLVAG